ARQGVVPRRLPPARPEHRPEDARAAAAHSGDRGLHHRALLGPCRHLGREEGVPSGRDEDRPARVPGGRRPSGRRRTRLGGIGLPARGPPHRAGHGGQGRRQARPSAQPAAHGLRARLTRPHAMKKLTIDSLLKLEDYAKQRAEFRRRVMEHKKNRALRLGDHLSLLFEDELTVRYQVQEMLRIERTFEEAGIQEELDAYNPLIPDGGNLKATMMIEYPDENVRRERLVALKGIERTVWLRVEGCDRVYPVADEDLDRETEDKTSAVHFLRFELGPVAAKRLKEGAALAAGVEHPEYRFVLDPVP